MLTKLQTLKEEREQGFTLIELLVVILIIGILSAIAIPAFLNQRKSAVDSSVQSDVSNAAKMVETALVKEGGNISTVEGDESSITVGGQTLTGVTAVKVSKGTTLTVSGDSDGYTIVGKNTGGDVANGAGFTYKSAEGGMSN